MAIQIQYRRGLASEWTAANTVLAVGEPGYETDTGKFKVGDGSTAWNSLAYSSGPTGSTGATGLNPVFSRQGTLTTSTSTGAQRLYVERSGTITVARASVGTAPTGSAITVDILKNGTTILTTPISIAANGFTATGTLATTTVSAGDYFIVTINSIGSTIAGANLTVTLQII